MNIRFSFIWYYHLYMPFGTYNRKNNKYTEFKIYMNYKLYIIFYLKYHSFFFYIEKLLKLKIIDFL